MSSLSPALLLFFQSLMGGLFGLIGASVAMHWGWRAADRMGGESRFPHCVYCLRPLNGFDLLPLFGWLFRFHVLSFPCPCGQKKGLWQQPLTEMIGLLLGMLAMYLVGWSGMAIPLCLALGVLPAIALIDLHFGIIPDELNLGLGLLGFLWVAFGGGSFAIALLIGGGLLAMGLFFALTYSRWRKKEMLGLGDVKFFAAAGVWLQPEMIPWFLAIGGGVGAVAALMWKRLGRGTEVPFAPSLCFALAFCLLYQLVGIND